MRWVDRDVAGEGAQRQHKYRPTTAERRMNDGTRHVGVCSRFACFVARPDVLCTVGIFADDRTRAGGRCRCGCRCASCSGDRSDGTLQQRRPRGCAGRLRRRRHGLLLRHAADRQRSLQRKGALWSGMGGEHRQPSGTRGRDRQGRRGYCHRSVEDLA